MTSTLLLIDNLMQRIHVQLSQKQKLLSVIFLAVLESMLNVEHCQKIMTLMAHVFKKLRVPKNVIR